MYFTYSVSGVLFALIRIIVVTMVLFLVYCAGGILAGDVKLLALIAGYLATKDVAKYIILVFYVAAFIGLIKIFFKYISVRDNYEKTTIKFTAPILLSFLILFYTKGGI